ncbi:MAG: hypothetical protein QOJ78_7 [Pseudonocardiales bacterium]|nr:hypothetical protein [Pseudonocardiales bacterium]
MTEPKTKPAPRRPPPPVPSSKKAPPPPPPQWAKPQRGLSTPSPTKVKSESSVGTWTEQEDKRGYLEDPETGAVIGTKDEQSSTVGAGVKGSRTTSTDTFDGTTQKVSSTKVEGLAGAEAAVKIISMATEQELTVAIEAMAKAGAFGEAEARAAFKRGSASGSAKGSAKGGAGVEGAMLARAKVDRSGLIPALEATFDAAIKAGIWGEASVDVEARYGPLVATALAKIEGFIGVSAEVSAKAFAGWKEGIGAEFSAKVEASASAKGSVTAEIGLGDAQLEVGAGFEAWAGAKADLAAKLEVSLEGVSASFKASAFAGAKFEVHANAAFKVRGKTIVSAKGKVGVAVGAGAEIGGEFELKHGKLKISGELAAALKGGVTAKGELEIDFLTLAEVLVQEIGDLAKGDELKITTASPAYDRKPLSDPEEAAKKEKLGYETVIDDFHAYARKKLTGGEKSIKQERIQEIIQNRAGQLHSAFAFTETDQGITRAAQEAFGPLLKSIVIQAGQIRAFQPAPETDATKIKQDFQQREQWRVARDSLADDFRAYGEKKAQSGKEGIKQEKVQSIVSKHWKQLQAAFPGAEADQVVVFAAKVSISKYLSKFEVANGKITEFDAPPEKAAAVKKGAADGKANLAQTAAVGVLRGKLVAYRASLVTKPKAVVERGELQKVITGSISSIKDQIGTPELDGEIASAIVAVLAPIVEATGITIINGQIRQLTPTVGGLDTARTSKTAEGEKGLQAAAMTGLTVSLERYKEAKTKGGAAGIKREEVESRILKATEKVRPWVQTGEADETIKQVASDALQPLLKSIGISLGNVVSFDAPARIAADEKRNRKENGRARLGGDEDDNTRRRMVSDAVGGEFATYAERVRAAAEKALAGKPATVKLERGKLQSIIDKRIKLIRADIVNEVGDEALVLAAQDKFGSMLKSISIVKSQIVLFDPEPNFATIAKAKRDTSAQVTRAQSDLIADLKTYAAEATKAGRQPGKSDVQALINKHKSKFSGVDEDEADLLLTGAVVNAFGERIRSVKIHGGVLHFFLLSVVPVPSR